MATSPSSEVSATSTRSCIGRVKRAFKWETLGLVLGTTAFLVPPASVWGETITEFTLPTAMSQPMAIIAGFSGPNGDLWFTEAGGNKVGRITTAGVITEFIVPTPGSIPSGIVSGPLGNVWFTEAAGNKIGRISPAGVITEFPIPTANSSPSGIVMGPDGNLWFTETGGNKIARITPAGILTSADEFPVPTANSSPTGITVGPGANLWFTEQSGNKIGRITTTGVITEFTIPTTMGTPLGIASGSDNNLWFTEVTTNRIGQITPNGAVTEFTIPTTNSAPYSIAPGPDGNLWFTERSGNKIGRITPAGTITEFTIPTGSSDPVGIASGPDSNMWFVEESGNKIGQFVLSPPCVPPPPDMTAWWPFDETSGTAAIDLAGVPNSGILLHGPTHVPGMVSYALHFDGVNDFVKVMNHSELNFGTDNLSIDAWIRTAGTTDILPIVDKRTPASGGIGYTLFLSNGYLAFKLADGSGSADYLSTAFVANGQWRHVAVTVQRTTSGPLSLILYVDGAQAPGGAFTNPKPGSLTNLKQLRIGKRYPMPGAMSARFFTGDIDELELFNRELQPTEIWDIFNAGSAGKCK